MKKPIIITLLTFIIVAGTFNLSQAQSIKSDSHFGIKLGTSLTTLGTYAVAGVGSYNYNYRAGFQGGFYAGIPIAAKFYLMPQVLFTQNGGNIEIALNGHTSAIKTGINYLSVPVLIAFKPVQKLTVSAGPEVDFLLSQTTSRYSDSELYDKNTDKQSYRKSLIGANLGIGYNLVGNLGINANYMFSFKSAVKDFPFLKNMENRGFAFTLSYGF